MVKSIVHFFRLSLLFVFRLKLEVVLDFAHLTLDPLTDNLSLVLHGHRALTVLHSFCKLAHVLCTFH